MKDDGLQQDGALFTIGKMARMFDLNIRTLRYYDQIGLLKPEFVNAQSGYRYYSTQQFERLNTIKYLRALDVSIERIAEFLENRDVELMKGVFMQQLEAVREKQRELELVEQKIKRRIGQIEQAVSAHLGEVDFVDLGERRVVSLEKNISPADDIEMLIRDLGSRSRLDDAIFLGKVAVSVSLENLENRSFKSLSGVLIIVEEGDGYQRDTEVVPAGCFARMCFRGTHRDAEPHYRRLLDAIGSAGMAPCGYSIETTLIDAGMTSEESQFVTEIQIPVG